jgi:streptogramin lyase
MKKIIPIMILAGFSLHSYPQVPVGSWADHLSYSTANSLAVTNDEVFASTGSSVMVFDRELSDLRKLSTINGLSETGISTLGWADVNNSLIIAYSTSNIDLVKAGTVFNIPDIKRKYIPGDKMIYKIRTSGKFAYLACGFGIVVIDVIKNEISDTWKPGNGSGTASVFDLTFGDGKIFAATSQGLFFADPEKTGLSYFGNWEIITSLPDFDGKYNAVIYSGNKIYVNRNDSKFPGDSIYVIDDKCSLFKYIPGVYNRSFDRADNGFTISSQGSIRIFDDNGLMVKNITSYGWGTPDMAQAIAENGNIWIADKNEGFLRGSYVKEEFTRFELPGPVSNNVVNISSVNGKTYIAGGGTDNAWNNLWRPLQISVHENNEWVNFYSDTIKDIMRILPDPFDKNRFFVSTWGGGLLEFRNNSLFKKYDDSNSPLKTIIPGKPFSRICGLAFDKDRNLWISQSEMEGTLKALKPDGTTWIVNPATAHVPSVGDLLITKAGHKWVILPRGFGLFVLDDNNTPENFSDDRSKKLLIKDTENKTVSYVYSLAEDLDGNVWVGTDQGPLIYYDPEDIFDDNARAFRILIPRNDGSGLSDYMLENESVTSIAVDGANRKWLGTFSSGAYLLSPDGTTLIKNYKEENSPLISNIIVSIAIDQKTGEVWFGTSNGVMSLRGNASAGEEGFKKVYSFPNPVREDFHGDVTITGLERDTEIKITDISGNLVYETVSDGGMATWNLKTYNGKRVSTGVYLVFCSSSDGSRSFVTKMLVIR